MYINPDNDGINNYDWTNFIYIRYAEVLLTFAEARNEICLLRIRKYMMRSIKSVSVPA